jgi:uncharacterized repeat protein (TIGR03803 family)
MSRYSNLFDGYRVTFVRSLMQLTGAHIIRTALFTCCSLFLAHRSEGQSFTNIYSFSTASGSYQTNSDGATPNCTLLAAGETLYGTAATGGNFGSGTIFAYRIDLRTFTALHQFTARSGSGSTNSDGWNPAGLSLDGATLYGTTSYGGTNGAGVVFSINTNGSAFKLLHTFTASNDGAYPAGRLVVSSNVLFGTTLTGGAFQQGTVFKLNTDGSGFTVLHTFTAAPLGTNADGGHPDAGLTLIGNTFYGTGYGGGAEGSGVIFKLNSDGSRFSTMHSFGAGSTPIGGETTNSDGYFVRGELCAAGATLYGSAERGGLEGSGTLFSMTTNGVFTLLHTFAAEHVVPSGNYTNKDGIGPVGTLLALGNTLYGVTSSGLKTSSGGIFGVTTDGGTFSLPYTFGALSHGFYGTNSGGAMPSGGMAVLDDGLYGVSSFGGAGGTGCIYRLGWGLDLYTAGTNVILSWPTNAPAFTLLSTDTLSSGSWITNSIVSTIIGGKNTVTDVATGVGRFYRLRF